MNQQKDLLTYKIIEIEIFSYCNRICGWCPNAYIDRTNFNYLDESIFTNFLLQLKKYNYSNVFSFSRYNEPFADFKSLQYYCKIVKNIFPNNKLVSNTNGDFLNKKIIQTMLIDELTIMNYDNIPKEKVYKKLRKWGIINIQDTGNYFLGETANKKILYYYNWDNIIIGDRGGSLKEYSNNIRNYPCYEPLYFLGLNYDGTLSPCCNIRNDIQTNYILGDLNIQSFEDIMANQDFINKVIQGNFSEEMPCYKCNNCGGRYSRENGGIEYE